jgi:hypothetical protein
METKNLLYYLNAKVMTRPFYGQPVIYFNFCCLETKELISLGVCSYNEEIEKITGQKYYKNILDATEHFDILWDASSKDIKPLPTPLDVVYTSYYKMLNAGVDNQSAHNYLLQEYSNINVKRKALKM